MSIIIPSGSDPAAPGPAGWGPVPTTGTVASSIPPAPTIPSVTQVAQTAAAATQTAAQAIFLPPIPAQAVMAVDPTGTLLRWFQDLIRKLGGYSTVYLSTVATTAPLTGSGTPATPLKMAAATATVPGYLLAADWVIFNGKQAALGFTPLNATAQAVDSAKLGGQLPVFYQVALGFAPINKAGDTGIGDLSVNSLSITTVGKTVGIKEGTNAKMGTATLAAGTVTVSTTAVAANSRIMLTPQSLGTILRPTGVGVTARTVGTSFVITSMDSTDTSTIAWVILDPL